MNRRIYERLRADILQGRLSAGARLLSSRALSDELGVSRNTVLFAYEQLAAEGYVETRAGAGTFVVQSLAAGTPEATTLRRDPDSVEPPLSSAALRIARTSALPLAGLHRPSSPLRYDFRHGEGGDENLSLRVWARLLGRRARSLTAGTLTYRPSATVPALREELANYLSRARGVVCRPEQIVVTHGSQQVIDICMRLFVDPGDPVVVEEPRYRGYSMCLAACGAKVVQVPVDEQGIEVDALNDVSHAKIACITPSHQFPTGAVLSLTRRLELLNWAGQRSAIVLEDDYDGEFRHTGRPIPCLQSLDRRGLVIYTGSASKMMFPSLRIGWAVVPASLAAVFRHAKVMADRDSATLEQLAFADFIREGALDRHIRRIRRRQAKRREALVDAVRRELGERVELLGTSAGFHVLVRLRDLTSDRFPLLRDACRQREVGIYSAALYYDEPPAQLELLLGYASLSQEDISTGIQRFREALDTVR
ncbi:MAG: PLP-dependent aminotransferase family protein [Gammaproteobacteria bacterium]|nr:PLP-dependent aminotransferase family protein [Gammaproteobacteria bacterium]